MIRLSSLRVRLVGTVFLAVVFGWLVAVVAKIEIAGFAAGLMALIAAWFGGEHFIIHQIRVLLATTKRLASGDYTARTGVIGEKGELGELAQAVDAMAGSLQLRVQEREYAESSLRTRAQQQSAVASLGQFALTTNDFSMLMDQSVALLSQTLEVELCEILELSPDTNDLVLRAGTNWRDGMIGKTRIELSNDCPPLHAIKTFEAVLVADYRTDPKFKAHSLAAYHGAISGITVAISGRDPLRPFGVLGAHSKKARIFTNDDEQFVRAVANLLAMTCDRRRAEAEIRKRAAFAQLNPTPAIELNRSGEVTYFNEAAERLARRIGLKHPRQLLPATINELVGNTLMNEHDRVDFETNQAGHTFSWLVHPVTSDQLVHCYITDVTERVKMETNLRQADKMLAIGQLAAGVAHDFNNMLTVIQGRAGMLLKSSSSNDPTRESAEAISHAAERAAGLTKQLLMFSRKNVKQSVMVNLAETVQGMSDMLNRLVGETVSLEFNPPTKLARIAGDGNEIEQVIMNLVVNARDAMISGGSIRITAEMVAITPHDILLRPQARPGEFVRMNVTDDGCGMDKATMDRIFEPFFTTKEVGKGTGLGLATVYGIVKQHEGWIEVESKPGKGTTFSIFFPAASTPVDVTVASKAAGADKIPLGGDETILVVEDEAELREMVIQILEGFGYKHFQAGSGAEALEIWKQHSKDINLVLTDMVMPGGISGRDLAKALVDHKAHLPIVIASGYSMDDLSTELAESKHISFVQKPYTLDRLARAIRTALDAYPRVVG